MPLTRDVFDGATAERRLAAYFSVATTASFGTFSRTELTAPPPRSLTSNAPSSEAPAAVAAGARIGKPYAVDRPGDAEQSGTGAHAQRRAARLPARRNRSHRDRGRLAPAGTAARGTAHRPGRDRPSPRCGRRLRRRRRRTPRPAQGACRRPGSRARIIADRPWPWRPARPGGDPRRHSRGSGIFRAAQDAACRPPRSRPDHRRAAAPRSGHRCRTRPGAGRRIAGVAPRRRLRTRGL